jgi:plasmid stabilization system protein ParE
MSYQFIFSPTALGDYKDAVEWYKVRSNKAAENFVVDVKQKLKIICENPFRFKNRYKNFRESSLTKYPFYIIYFVDKEKNVIVISSLYHHKRNPKSKYGSYFFFLLVIQIIYSIKAPHSFKC